MASIVKQIAPILINNQRIDTLEITDSARKHWRGGAAGIIGYVASTLDGKTLKAIPGDMKDGHQVHCIYSNTAFGVGIPSKGKSSYRDHRMIIAGTRAIFFHSSPRTKNQYERNIKFTSFE